jgi:CBS domain-containing protein
MPVMKKTQVEQVMTTPVITATGAMPFRDPVALLYAREIGAVPVVTPAGQVLGVLSNHDLIAKAAGLPAVAEPLPPPRSRRCGRRSLARTAGELMTTPAVTLPPRATIKQAAASCAAGNRNGSPAKDLPDHAGA